MDRAVVKVADSREVPQLVPTAAALVLDVMQIEPDISAASGHGAVVAVSRQYLLALAGRDGRGRPLRARGVERAELYGIAGGALDHGRIDLDVSAAAELPRTVTVWTPLDGDLVCW